MTDGERHVRPDDVETMAFDWGRIKWLSTPDVTDAQEFSAGVVQVEPGDGHERHNHPDAEEILYVLEGEGTQTVEGDEFDIEAGDLVHIPEGVYHSTMNTGWETLSIFVVYGPPGPEQLLREDPDVTIYEPGDVPE